MFSSMKKRANTWSQNMPQQKLFLQRDRNKRSLVVHLNNAVLARVHPCQKYTEKWDTIGEFQLDWFRPSVHHSPSETHRFGKSNQDNRTHCKHQIVEQPIMCAFWGLACYSGQCGRPKYRGRSPWHGEPGFDCCSHKAVLHVFSRFYTIIVK